MSKKVVIIGGGFGGLAAAKALNKADVEITLIDKTNHHLFQPLLYQVATAALSPGDIAAPIRGILRNQRNIRVIMGEVERIDTIKKQVYLDNDHFDYDYLIVSAGSCSSYYGKDEWEKFAIGLKTIPDALRIRENILLSFEKAERANEEKEIQKHMTLVIVGGGATGVEMAGAIAELSKQIMLRDFRRIDPYKTKIILLEASDRILSTFDPYLSSKAKIALEQLGVNVRLNTKVTNIDENGIWIGEELVETKSIIWVAGTMAPSLISSLNTETDRLGRVLVESDCSVRNYSSVFVIGDAALYIQDKKPLPAVAPVAIQQGKYVAKIIRAELSSKKRKPFKYRDNGNLATIGRAKAVLQVRKVKVSGFIAWIAWAFVHIIILIQFRNRYKVMAEWIWYYVTHRPGIRLITIKRES
jgi:NADH:ubiquinone reductase (H+-translocating)